MGWVMERRLAYASIVRGVTLLAAMALAVGNRPVAVGTRPEELIAASVVGVGAGTRPVGSAEGLVSLAANDDERSRDDRTTALSLSALPRSRRHRSRWYRRLHRDRPRSGLLFGPPARQRREESFAEAGPPFATSLVDLGSSVGTGFDGFVEQEGQATQHGESESSLGQLAADAERLVETLKRRADEEAAPMSRVFPTDAPFLDGPMRSDGPSPDNAEPAAELLDVEPVLADPEHVAGERVESSLDPLLADAELAPLEEAQALVGDSFPKPSSLLAVTTGADIDTRPNAGKDPDVVNFGISIKNFYGFTPADGTFKADIIMAFQWQDERAGKLVTTGDSLTLPQDAAEKQMWMPAMGLVSQNIDGVQVLSTSVTVDKKGNVHKIQRVIALLMHAFNGKDYPMETQTIQIILSSTKYMSEDLLVRLLPDNDTAISKVPDAVFEGSGFSLVDFKPVAWEEVSGALHKSRGRLEVNVKRSTSKFLTSIIVPSLITVLFSYSVFWLPLATPFVMPRVAMAMFSHLSLMGLKGGYAAQLTGVNGASWGAAFISGFQVMLFVTVAFNIALECSSHAYNLTDISKEVNEEVRLFYPCLVLMVLVECLTIRTSFLCATIGVGFYLSRWRDKVRRHYGLDAGDAEAGGDAAPNEAPPPPSEKT